MRLSKLSFRNIRRSIKDYAIYFFTLILGVAIFYVFNAIKTQTVMLNIAEDTRELIDLLSETLSAVSVLVAFVLGALVVYASRFMMKRRHGEFALYMLLGMGKLRTAMLLLFETAIIGVISLAAGLTAGVVMSQVMSAVVVDLFEADMSEFTFVFSGEAFFKTILYFTVIMLVVLLMDVIAIGKSRLITLMQTGKRSEAAKAPSPVISCIMFVLGVVLLTIAYRYVLQGINYIKENEFIMAIAFGCISTFLIFYAISGLMLFVTMRFKSLYYRGINAFTIRQISSRIHTMVISMSIICLMLFVTICVLSSAFSIRSSMNEGLRELAPVDCDITVYEGKAGSNIKTVEMLFSDYGVDLTGYFKEYVDVPEYQADELTFGASLGETLSVALEKNPYLLYDTKEIIMKQSDYNKIAEIFNNKTYKIPEDKYIIVCNFSASKQLRDEALKADTAISVYGKSLLPYYDECVDGFVKMESTHTNTGIIVVPDEVIGEDVRCSQYNFVGNYYVSEKEDIKEIETVIDAVSEEINAEFDRVSEESDVEAYLSSYNTRTQIHEDSTGLGAFVTFLGLYIGIIFLIASAAVLALKAMTEQIDSVEKYRMLSKLGVENGSINKSIFIQELTFFLLPLILACIHSAVGIISVKSVLEIFGNEIFSALLQASLVLVVIYGGYFIITYEASKNLI